VSKVSDFSRIREDQRTREVLLIRSHGYGCDSLFCLFVGNWRIDLVKCVLVLKIA
jgi:hypothetical protein